MPNSSILPANPVIIDAVGVSTTQLEKLLAFHRRQDELLKELEEVRQGMEKIARGQCATLPDTRAIRPLPGHVRSPRGSVKGAIVNVIQAAGRIGVRVDQICEATGLDRRRVERFLYSASGKNSGLIKAGKAKFKMGKA